MMRDRLIKKKYQIKTNLETDYIFAKGQIPICLVAHLDTVNSSPPSSIFIDSDAGAWFCGFQPAGFDDRAGLFAILEILELGYRPHILLLDKEEIGGLGAQSFVNDFKDKFPCDCKFFIELDRQGIEEVVFYSCNNKNFKKFLRKAGFKEENGTFSDISLLMPYYEICGCNVSVGYINEHSASEMFFEQAYLKTISNLCKILNKKKLPNFKWVEKITNFYYYNNRLYNTNNFSNNTFKNDDEIYNCVFCNEALTTNDISNSRTYRFKGQYRYACAKCEIERKDK